MQRACRKRIWASVYHKPSSLVNNLTRSTSPSHFLPGYVQELIVGLLDAPSWRSSRPMYSSWLLDCTCQSAGRQLYKGHKDRYTLGGFFFSVIVSLSIVVLYSILLTLHILRKSMSTIKTRDQQASCPDACLKFSFSSGVRYGDEYKSHSPQSGRPS
jgi:hypothetical protein